ncbi:glycosyltransferase family 2 protein [Candidatus Saccharibacteria bacterium]|nr:glycosyltransferase family 2 protein [Candidatus Saccharibacteria bacterium]
MKKPLISIIVPVFNTEKFLSACLSSILAQDYKNFELILVDNGSSDNSVKVCKEYAQKDSRIKLATCNKPGAAHARNKGLDEAKGEYIVFIDSDDIVSKDYLSFLFEASENGKYGLVCAKYTAFDKVFNPQESPTVTTRLSKAEAISGLLTQRISAGPVCKLYRTSLLKDLVFENYAVGEDLYLNYNYLKKCSGIVSSNHIIYGYRNNTSSLTKKRFYKRRMDGLTVMRTIAETEKYSTASVIRYFMEAYFIVEIIDISREASKYPVEVRECKQILKKYRQKVLFAKIATKKQRFIALLCYINTTLPARVINILKNRTKK